MEEEHKDIYKCHHSLTDDKVAKATEFLETITKTVQTLLFDLAAPDGKIRSKDCKEVSLWRLLWRLITLFFVIFPHKTNFRLMDCKELNL